MRTLQDVRLNGREFGRDLLAWDALAAWLTRQPAPADLMTLFPEGPAAAVQVEYFLTRIEVERLDSLTPADAVVQVLPEEVPNWLQDADLNNPTIRHWVLGAAAHNGMRNRIRDAVNDGSLTLLHGLTLSPKQAPVAELPDPQRRLAALKATGGCVTYFKGNFIIKGIVKLTAAEKAAGRSRSDQKTIRIDLLAAAEAERREGTKPALPSRFPT